MSGVRGRWQPRSAPAPPCRNASGIWTKKLARADDSLYFALQSLSVSSVTDLHKALAEIHSIGGQLARNAEFRGYGPATLEMIHSALEQFLPGIVAGFLLTGVLLRCAPQSLWMLPGLWQVLFSMGVFASCRFLPRQM